MDRFKSSVIIYTIRQIFIFVLSTIANLYVTKILTQEHFGKISIYNSAVMVLAFFSETGFLAGFLQRSTPITQNDIQKIFTLQSCVFGFLILVGAIIFIFDFTWLNDFDSIFFLAIITAYAISIQNALFSNLQKNLDIIPIALNDVLTAIIYSSSIIYFAYQGFGAFSLVYGYLLKSTFSGILAMFQTRTIPFFSPFWRDRDFISSIKVGFINQGAFALSLLRNLATPILIPALIGISALGLLDRSIYLAGLVSGIINSVFQKILFPFVAKQFNQQGNIKDYSKKTIFYVGLMEIGFYLPLVLLIKPFVYKFLGPSWSGLEIFVYILAFGNFLFSSYTITLGTILMGLGRFRFLFKLNLLQLLITWTLGFILIKSFGLLGYTFTSIFLLLSSLLALFEIKNVIGNLHCKYEYFLPKAIFVLVGLIHFPFLKYFEKSPLHLEIGITGTSCVLFTLVIAVLLDRRHLPSNIKRLRERLGL